LFGKGIKKRRGGVLLWIRSEDIMPKENNAQQTSISQARSIEEIADFWDTHSLADYWDQTREVEFEVRAKRRRRITLDPEVYAQIEVQARERGISPETLVNLWVVERLQKVG
jgi:predicted HicB family RNase H-like nuclease